MTTPDKPLVIAYVEDHDVDVQALIDAFRKRRIRNQIHVFHSGETYLETLVKGWQSYGIVLVDTELPGMLGQDLVRQLKTFHPGLAKTPIVIVAGSSEPDEVKLAAESGADGYVTKPIDPEALMKTINKAAEENHHLPPFWLEIVTGERHDIEGGMRG